MLSALLLDTPLVGIGGGGGGPLKEGSGGGGGGVGAADAEDTDLLVVWPEFTSLKASIASMPSLFHVTPDG